MSIQVETKRPSMKNVQVIDGATNCTYSIYEFTNDEFSSIFLGPGQDIEFIEDALQRLGPEILDGVLGAVWNRQVKKPDAAGIHGTLFYELSQKKRLYPSKSEQDVAGSLEPVGAASTTSSSQITPHPKPRTGWKRLPENRSDCAYRENLARHSHSRARCRIPHRVR